GAWIRTGQVLSLDVATIRAHGPWAFAKDLALGTAIFAPAVAALGGALTYAVATIFRTRTAFDDAVRRIAKKYGNRGPYFHVKGKLWGDPVTRAVMDLGELGEVCDVGCGRGQLGLLLLDGAKATRVWGV